MNELLTLFFIPFVASAITFACVPSQRINFIFSLIPLCFLLQADTLAYSAPWFEALSIHFTLSADTLSRIFLYLVNGIIPIAILAKRVDDHPKAYYSLILLLQGLLIGFFTARDLVFFTFFFEAILIPLYFIISRWGGADREKAAFTFIIYMVAGSCLMILGLFALYAAGSSFDLDMLQKTAHTSPYAMVIAAIFLLAFAVKTPLFPFHAWLADAYCQAPVGGTILLSALLSKAGIYGILRINIGLFPDIIMAWSPVLLFLAVTGVLYGAFAAWAQTDFKRLIAYSSFSHVNFILAALFVYNSMAHEGAILQSVNHAITITGLFLVAAWLETRLGTTSYSDVSGLASYMPKLAWLTLFFIMSSVALPGLNNFISEVMVLYGVLLHSIWVAALLGLTVILSILYMLRFFHGVYFDSSSIYKPSYQDIHLKEYLIAAPLVALILWLGIYPGPALLEVEKSTTIEAQK